MRLLLTSDWQCDYSNIDLCEQAQAELLAWAHEHKVDAILNLGDLKERYDPIHGVVVKFWVRAIRQITRAGFRFIALRGNHDLLSRGHGAHDWMDVLRAAGAEVASGPKIIEVGDGIVALLPFTLDKEEELRWANRLADGVAERSGPKALCFHTEIEGASLNGHTQARGSSLEDLHIEAYDAAFGGHIHAFQEIMPGKAWYVGSPFAMDWGEADQKKGCLLVEVE